MRHFGGGTRRIELASQVYETKVPPFDQSHVPVFYLGFLLNLQKSEVCLKFLARSNSKLCLRNKRNFLMASLFFNHAVLAGTSKEEKCDIGTFNNQTGQENIVACISCTGGFYCDAQGLDEPTAPCAERYEAKDLFFCIKR